MSNAVLGLGVSGMVAQSHAMDVIGNNVANSRTFSYKSGTTNFSDAFYGPGIATANGLRNQRGQGVTIAGTYYDWTTGVLEHTGVMTHLAIAGDGFLPVQYGDEVRYTRAGDFMFAERTPGAGEFVLMRPGGDMLLDSELNVVTFDAIPTALDIKADGTLLPEGATTTSTRLGVQAFANPDALIRDEGGTYALTDTVVLSNDIGASLPGEAGTGFLRQGALEQSNVDLIREFTQMISAQRAFQANSKTVTTADAMMQEVLNLKR